MKSEYTVIWKRSVIERTLALIVLKEMEGGRAVEQIVEAMREIDRRLSARPESEGESRNEDDRILIVAPLAVTYEVYSDERVVFVRSAQYRPPGGSS